MLEGELDIVAVARLVRCHRNSINDWIELFRNGGVEALLKRGEDSGRKGKMTAEIKAELTEKLKAGEFRTAGQAEAKLKEKHPFEFGTNSIYYQLGKLGGRLKVARPSHLKKDEEAASAFKITLAEKMKQLELPTGHKIKFWVYDEMRYGLHPLVRRVWSLKGVRVVTPVERRFEWGYLFDVLEVGGGASEFLYSPTVNKEAKIRQDAILLALRWFEKCANKEEWVPAASVAYSLRYIKLRYARRLSKRPEHVQMDEELTPASLVLPNPDTKPMSGRPHAAHMAIQAIHQATQCGHISTTNAAIVLMVLQDGHAVSTIARDCRQHRGARFLLEAQRLR